MTELPKCPAHKGFKAGFTKSEEEPDLSGEVVDTVTEEEQQQAIAQLKTMRRRRGKPRQTNQAKEQVEGPLTPDPVWRCYHRSKAPASRSKATEDERTEQTIRRDRRS